MPFGVVTGIGRGILHGLVLLLSDDFLRRFVIVLLVDIVLNCFYQTLE